MSAFCPASNSPSNLSAVACRSPPQHFPITSKPGRAPKLWWTRRELNPRPRLVSSASTAKLFATSHYLIIPQNGSKIAGNVRL